MAGMKGLVDASASCGDVNPLMKLTTHFSQDRGKTDAGFSRQKRKNKFTVFENLQKVAFNIASRVYILNGQKFIFKIPKMVHFREFLKT